MKGKMVKIPLLFKKKRFKRGDSFEKDLFFV